MILAKSGVFIDCGATYENFVAQELVAHGIGRARVLCEGNIEVRGDVVYAPAYLTLAVGGPAGS